MPREKVGVLGDKRFDLRTTFGSIAEDGLARNLGIALGFGHSTVLVYFLFGSVAPMNRERADLGPPRQSDFSWTDVIR
jgi:hypothetical protein